MTDADAVLLLSFGGPEHPDDIMPFLRNVTRGRNVPDERLEVVADQYRLLGGRSPINDHNRQLIAALRIELDDAGIDLPIYWGNRNWSPFLADTVATMATDRIRRALVFVTSAFGSYSGCRQYREDLAAASAATGASAPRLDKLRLFYNHPDFIEPLAANVQRAMSANTSSSQRLIFTAHSIPTAMASVSDYETQLTEAAGLIVERLAPAPRWDLVFQSRSGPPSVPWLEPDICDHLETMSAAGVDAVTVVPLGFVSDHMEVLYDLDTQARARADELGISFSRAATVGTAPQFVTMIRKLIEERTTDSPRLCLGSSGPWPDDCPEGHCVAQPSRQSPNRD